MALLYRGVRYRGLLLARISVLTGCDAVSLSSFGREGQGEEVVVLRQHARYIGAETRWNVATNLGGANQALTSFPRPPTKRFSDASRLPC